MLLQAAPVGSPGAPRTLATLASEYFIVSLFADETSVYWIRDDVLYRVSRSGGAVANLGRARSADAHGGRVYWSELPPYGSTAPACLFAADPDGGNRVCLDRSAEPFTLVRADDRSVFYVRGGTTLLRAPR